MKWNDWSKIIARVCLSQNLNPETSHSKHLEFSLNDSDDQVRSRDYVTKYESDQGWRGLKTEPCWSLELSSLPVSEAEIHESILIYQITI